MIEQKALDKIFDRSIDSWTHSTSFIDLCTSRALALSRFTRLGAKFIKICTYETADDWRIMKKADGFPSLEVGNSWLQLPPSSSFSNESDRGKQCRKHRKVSTPKMRDHTCEAKPKDRYSTESLDCDTSSASFRHIFTISNLAGKRPPWRTSTSASHSEEIRAAASREHKTKP